MGDTAELVAEPVAGAAREGKPVRGGDSLCHNGKPATTRTTNSRTTRASR